MAKLCFKYGAMGSSKSAQALITKFNYEEQGMKVWLIKPALDDRNGAHMISSRIGLYEMAEVIYETTNIVQAFEQFGSADVIIADECQFFTAPQIDALRTIVDTHDIPVICYGLRTDFLTHAFPGSLRLFEVADNIVEIKTICKCGAKAIVNARFDADGRIVTEGSQIFLGGNESYHAMCHRCWKREVSDTFRL